MRSVAVAFGSDVEFSPTPFLDVVLGHLGGTGMV